MEDEKARVIGIMRHRLQSDGDGVTTLVAFHGCPLRCRYCLNPQSLGGACRFPAYSPMDLYSIVCIDNLYFLASGGGVTFGGGEPAERAEFISEFRDICGPEWKINIETSLNVDSGKVARLLDVVDMFIIDIKDMNQTIYRNYTGKSNILLRDNLSLIEKSGRQRDCIIRLPFIFGFNTEADRLLSRRALEDLGFYRFDFFNYQIREH